jgi:hypothetical protein
VPAAVALAACHSEVAGPVEAVENPLAELSALGDEMVATGPEAGGSIRAKRDVPLDRLARDPCELEAKVEEVVRGTFPLAAVRVRVLQPPVGGPGSGLEKNQVVVLLPRLAMDQGRVAYRDAATVRNTGAFYLKRGDRLRVRLEERRAGGQWWFTSVERH